MSIFPPKILGQKVELVDSDETFKQCVARKREFNFNKRKCIGTAEEGTEGHADRRMHELPKH